MDSVIYGGQAVESTTKNEDDANAYPFLISSGFTAINHSQTQLLTPNSSAVASVRPGQTSSGVIGNSRHNPDVARYLGLGSTTEPAHLEKYAPRRRPAVRQTKHCSPASLTQRSPQRPGVTYDSNTNAPITDDRIVSHAVRPENISHVTPRNTFGSDTVPPISQDAVEAAHAGDFHSSLLTTSLGDDAALGTFPHENDELLCQNNNDTTTNDNDYEFDITDGELLVLTSGSCFDTSHNVSNLAAESPDSSNDKTRAINDDRDNVNQDASAVDSSQRIHNKFVSPITTITRLLAASRDEETAQIQKPIVRPPFPKSVRDRSPILGLSSNVVLRTCFRIGEAINQSHKASKSGQQMMIELYARVFTSERTATQQYFTFCDLFHIRPPYIKGAYDAAIWRAVPLFEYDSRRLLQQGRICRCIGVIKHNSKERIMTIHNIWEATWDDIQWAEGIVCS